MKLLLSFLFLFVLANCHLDYGITIYTPGYWIIAILILIGLLPVVYFCMFCIHFCYQTIFDYSSYESLPETLPPRL